MRGYFSGNCTGNTAVSCHHSCLSPPVGHMAWGRLEQRAEGVGCPPAEGAEHQHLEPLAATCPLLLLLCQWRGTSASEIHGGAALAKTNSRFRCEWVCWSTMGRRTALHSLDVSAKPFWEKWCWERGVGRHQTLLVGTRCRSECRFYFHLRGPKHSEFPSCKNSRPNGIFFFQLSVSSD